MFKFSSSILGYTELGAIRRVVGDKSISIRDLPIEVVFNLGSGKCGIGVVFLPTTDIVGVSSSRGNWTTVGIDYNNVQSINFCVGEANSSVSDLSLKISTMIDESYVVYLNMVSVIELVEKGASGGSGELNLSGKHMIAIDRMVSLVASVNGIPLPNWTLINSLSGGKKSDSARLAEIDRAEALVNAVTNFGLGRMSLGSVWDNEQLRYNVENKAYSVWYAFKARALLKSVKESILANKEQKSHEYTQKALFDLK